jgi:hypothetical protein
MASGDGGRSWLVVGSGPLVEADLSRALEGSLGNVPQGRLGRAGEHRVSVG